MKKAEKMGAVKSIAIDAREEFIRDYVFKAHQGRCLV